jgi:hypothetical protein
MGEETGLTGIVNSFATLFNRGAVMWTDHIRYSYFDLISIKNIGRIFVTQFTLLC